jgi:hypothetical protein
MQFRRIWLVFKFCKVGPIKPQPLYYANVAAIQCGQYISHSFNELSLLDCTECVLCKLSSGNDVSCTSSHLAMIRHVECIFQTTFNNFRDEYMSIIFLPNINIVFNDRNETRRIYLVRYGVLNSAHKIV